MPRGATLAGRLAALGFADTAAAERRLISDLRLDVGGQDADLVAALAAAPDPDLALAGLTALAPDQELRERLRSDQGLRTRLITILGVSSALAEHLRRHRDDWRLLVGPPLVGPALVGPALVGAAPAGRALTATTPAALRVEYRRRLLTLAARDLTGAAALDEVTAELADLAAAAIAAALTIAASQLPPGLPPCRLAIIAMGKCGARELNYASDVDVIFV